jgi:Sulfatase
VDNGTGVLGLRRHTLEVAALYGFYVLAILKPIVDMVTAAPGIMVLHNLTVSHIVVFLAVLFLGPAAVLLPLWIWRRSESMAGLGAVAILAACLAALAVAAQLRQAQIFLSPDALGFASAAAALTVAVAFWRSQKTMLELAALMGVMLMASSLWAATILLPAAKGSTLQVRVSDPVAVSATNVVVVILDELSSATLMTGTGELNRARFPGFARLHDASTWYRNASSIACYTELALPAILTGRYPEPRRTAPSYYEYPDSLFSLLAPTHQAQAWEPITRLCPSGICPGRARFRLDSFLDHISAGYAHIVTPRNWQNRLPDIDAMWVGAFVRRQQDNVVAGDRRVQIEDFLAAFEQPSPGSRPSLKVMHVALPHAPFEYLPSGQHYFAERTMFAAKQLPGGYVVWDNDAAHVHQTYLRHVLQTMYVDRMIGRLIDTLQRTGQWDRTLLVVTADHGAAYAPSLQRRETLATNYALQAGVPLFIRRPAQTVSATDDRPALNVDILPTTAKLLGIDLAGVDGIDLTSTLRTGDAAASFRHACTDTQTIPPVLRYGSWPLPVLPRLMEEAKRAETLFGTQAVPGQQFSPHSGWIGRPAADVAPVLSAQTGRAMIRSRLYNWDAADPVAPYVPVHVDGVIDGVSQTAAIEIVLELNGEIAAIMPTRVNGKVHDVSMVFDVARLHPGKNELKFFAVELLANGSPALLSLPLVWQ